MRERFDEKFPKNTFGGMQYSYRDGGVKDRENLLDFIEQELKKEREEIVEIIEAYYDEAPVDELVSKIKKRYE